MKNQRIANIPLVAEGLALLPAAVVLFFDRGTLTVFEPAKFQLFRTGIIVLLTIYGVTELRKGLFGLRRWPLILPVLTLNGVLLVALSGSLSPYWSFWGSYERAQGLFTWMTLSVFAYLVYQFSVKEAFVERLLSGMVGSSVLVVGYALIQALGFDPWQWRIEDTTFPVFSTLGRSNYLAGYLVLIIPITVGRLTHTSWNWQRVGLIVLIVAQGIALLLSRSRSGWLTLVAIMVIGLITLGVLQHSPRCCIAGVVLGGIAFGILLVLNLHLPVDLPELLRQNPLIERLSTLHITDTGSLAARLTIWRTSLSLIGQRPFLGYGPGTFTLAFARIYPPELVYYQGRETMVDHAHNLWLNLGVESGIPGILAMLALNLSVWWLGIRHLVALERPSAQFHQLALLLALLGNALVDLTQPPTAATLVITWTFYSLILPAPMLEKKRGSSRGRATPRSRLIVVLIAVVGTLICIGFCLRPVLAEHRLAYGLKNGNPGAIAQAQTLMPQQDEYFHQVGRFMAELQTERGFVSAESQFLHAIELCPAQPLYWADLGTLYLAWASYDASMLDKAEDAFQHALSVNGNQTLWLRGLGRVYFLRSEWKQSESVLRKIVSLDATDAQAYMQLGDLYYVQGHFSEAALAYMYARDLWPESALPLAGLGRSYYQQGECKEAIPLLEQSLQIESTGPLTYHALAACYAKQGQTVKAIKTIEEGLSLYPRAQALLEMLP